MAQEKAVPCPPKGTHGGGLTNIFECDKVLTRRGRTAPRLLLRGGDIGFYRVSSLHIQQDKAEEK